MRILDLHGPKPDALGNREPAVHGRATPGDLQYQLEALAEQPGCGVESRQGNREGVPIDVLHAAKARADGVLPNQGGLSHTSVAPRDTVPVSGLPVVEAHLSNPNAREAFRHTYLSSGAAVGAVQGFGPAGHSLALRGLVGVLSREDD